MPGKKKKTEKEVVKDIFNHKPLSYQQWQEIAVIKKDSYTPFRMSNYSEYGSLEASPATNFSQGGDGPQLWICNFYQPEKNCRKEDKGTCICQKGEATNFIHSIGR